MAPGVPKCIDVAVSLHICKLFQTTASMVNGHGVPAQKPVEMAFRLEPGISHSLPLMGVVNAQGQTPRLDCAISETAGKPGTLVSRKEGIIEETAKYSSASNLVKMDQLFVLSQ